MDCHENILLQVMLCIIAGTETTGENNLTMNTPLSIDYPDITTQVTIVSPQVQPETSRKEKQDEILETDHNFDGFPAGIHGLHP
jgi:hypothetical protein